MQVQRSNEAAEQPKEEKPLSREQRRIKERIEIEAKNTFDLLSDRFLNFFINHDDPEGNEVTQKLAQISSQWKTYCTKRQLIPQAKVMIDDFAASVLSDYRDNKYPKANADQVQG
jgi:hypothetical protein